MKVDKIYFIFNYNKYNATHMRNVYHFQFLRLWNTHSHWDKTSLQPFVRKKKIRITEKFDNKVEF